MSESPQLELTGGGEPFMDCLRKSGLLSDDQISLAVRKVQSWMKRNAESALDEQQLADRLIHFGFLTPWQSEKLRNGKYKGFHLGRYRLLDHLGSGGMGSVYLAEHRLSGLRRAIKVLPPNRIAERSYLSRFYREGRATASLNHPNIVRIYDLANDLETHFMVMEFVPGKDLYDMVSTYGPLEFDLARRAIVETAHGLAHAHENHLIHRDIKPANLLLTDKGQVKILDLGLALVKSEDSLANLSAQFNENMLGTADYLAPEQAAHSHYIDHRADIYSLGCTLYYLLTGRPPFNEGTVVQRITMHQTSDPPPVNLSRRDCPADLQNAIIKMMKKNPGDRFADCWQIIDALQ